MATERHRDGKASTSRTSTSGTSDVGHAIGTFSFTPNADTAYLVLVTGLLDWATPSVNARGLIKLKANGTEVASTGVSMTYGSTVYVGGVMLYIIPADPSPSAIAFTVTVAREGTTPGTIGLQDVVIRAVELLADDEWQISSGVATTTSDYPTYITKQTLTFTPATTDDYYVLSYLEYKNNDPRASSLFRTTSDGANIGVHDMRGAHCDTYQARLNCAKVNLDASSHSIASKYCRWGGFGTVSVQRSIIIALRGDTFEWADALNYATSTTSTSYVESSTLSKTTAAVEHWSIWGGNLLNTYNYGIATSVQQCQDGASELAADFKFQTGSTTWGLSMGNSIAHQETFTPSAASHNWSSKVKTASASGTAYTSGDLFVFQMEAAASASSNSGLLLLGVG